MQFSQWICFKYELHPLKIAARRMNSADLRPPLLTFHFDDTSMILRCLANCHLVYISSLHQGNVSEASSALCEAWQSGVAWLNGFTTLRANFSQSDAQLFHSLQHSNEMRSNDRKKIEKTRHLFQIHSVCQAAER